MNHLGDLLSAYLDGELRPDERSRVADHLQACGLCRTEVEEISEARAAVRSLPTLELPVVLMPAEAVRIAERERLGWRITAAAAAVAVVGVLGAFTLSSPEPQQITPPQLAQVHLARSNGTGLGASGMAALVAREAQP
jgi:anti-sigma factor RsiW